jgi:hypothetical protein
MLLQRVRQTACNRIFRVGYIIFRIYFHSYNRIGDGEKFTALNYVAVAEEVGWGDRSDYLTL